MVVRSERRRCGRYLGGREVTTGNRGPTLTDAVGMGGLIAQDGFDYQVWEGLVRLPAWLRNPAFEAMIFEGLEDLEARFFAPHAPSHHLLERFQAKSGALAPQDVKEVFQRFYDFERVHPSITRVHTLVTPQLPPTLKWIARDAARIRQARPFYAPFTVVRAASDTKFADDVVEELGDPLGRFVAEAVECVEHPLPSRDAALTAFGTALDAAFPGLELPSRRVQAVFAALEALAARSKGKSLSRLALTDEIEGLASAKLVPSPGFPIHVRSERSDSREDTLEIDASTFSGGGNPFPKSDHWTTGLIAPLDATAVWLKQQNVSRVALAGSYRISTAFAVGRSLRSAIGFELDIPTREGTWPTDDRPFAKTLSAWQVEEPQTLHGERLVISVGVLRRPREDLVAGGIPSTAILDCFLAQPITSGKEAQLGVSSVKDAVSKASARLRPTAIDLYIAGPAAFAVALGHRWNALPLTHLHEFDSLKRVYVRTVCCPS